MRAALYIDCGSIDAEDVPYIYEEIYKKDDLVISKIFAGKGDCQENFRDIVKKLRIHNSEYFENEEGSALVALAVEVMADAQGGDIQKIYLTTGDAGVLPLLDKLKLMKIEVAVIGPCDSDRLLIDNSEKYIYLDILNGGDCTAEIPSVEEIAGKIYSVSSYYNGMGENVSLEQLYSSLVRRYPDFDVRNYGYTHLSTFVKMNVTGIQVVKDACGEMYLSVVDDRKDIDDFAYEYVAGRGYSIEDMAELLEALHEKFPGFAMENYGYNTDYGFILSFPRFQIWENKGIKMKRSFKLSSKSEEDDGENL